MPDNTGRGFLVKVAICASVVLVLASTATWLLFPFRPRLSFEIDSSHIDGFSADSRCVIAHAACGACRSASGPIYFWDAGHGTLRGSFLDEATQFADLELSPDGRTLLLLDGAHQLILPRWQIWDLPSRALLSAEAMKGSLRVYGYSPDGILLAYEPLRSNHELDAFMVSELNLQTMQVKHREFQSETRLGHLSSVVYSPDCSVVTLNLRFALNIPATYSIELFDRTSGRRIGQLSQAKALAFSQNGKRLIGLKWDSASQVWLTYWTVDESGIHEGEPLCCLYEDNNESHILDLSPNGKLLAVTRFRTRTPSPIRQWYARLTGKLPRRNASAEITVIDVSSGKSLATLVGSNQPHFSPDGQLLATENDDGDTQIWDLPLKRPIVPMIITAAIPPVLVLFTGWMIYFRRESCERHV
jgi:WD40 repeat protein